MLSPPVPPKYSGTESYLISHAPFLNVFLVGISSVDSVQIFSLHGVVCIASGLQSFLLKRKGKTNMKKKMFWRTSLPNTHRQEKLCLIQF